MGEDEAPFPTQAWIDHPSEAGADLRVNAFAAHVFYQGPLIVIGFGTATTISLVNDQGDFCVTSIAPGVHIMGQALPRIAPHLPEINFKKPHSSLGLNTIDAMESGFFWGYLGLTQGLIAHLQQQQLLLFPAKNLEDKDSLKVIATGGYGALVAPHCPNITNLDSDLTLKGLALIFETKLKGK